MISKNEVGKKIKLIRRDLGYTQEQFAELLNVTMQAVSKWETGASIPDIDILLKVSWFGKCSINALLDSNLDYLSDRLHIDRGLQRVEKYLRCPKCKSKLHLDEGSKLKLKCDNNHTFNVIDGVIDFDSREIKGELWSLYLKNYEMYLKETEYVISKDKLEAYNKSGDNIFEHLKEHKPKVILDVACGTGNGIKSFIKKIDWPCLIILTDLSHRIQKYNKRYYDKINPFVELAYIACDCINIPILDESIDCVTSFWGFESMQSKEKQGFLEGNRIVKKDGYTVFNTGIIEDLKSDNSKFWVKETSKIIEEFNNDKFNFKDKKASKIYCKESGYSETKLIKICDEAKAPEDGIFPYENMILQWMAEYLVITKK